MVARVYNHTSAPVNPAAFLDQAEPDFGHWDIVRKMFEGTFIVSGCAVTAQGTPDQTVAVASGVVSIGNALVTVASGNVSLSAADATNARVDLITVDTSAVKGVTDGAADTNPCLPAYPANKCVIAVIYRPANDNTIESNLIETVGAAPRQLRYATAGVVSLYQATASGEALELSTNTPPGNAAANCLRLYAKVFGTGAGAFLKDQNGQEFGPIGTKEQATVFGRGPSGGMEPPGSATWSDGVWGTLSPAGLWTPTGTMSVANDTATRRGRYIEALSGAVAGNDAGVESATDFWANMDAAYLIRFYLPDITNIRFFAGIAAQTLATMVGADNPGTNHLGLQFSTPRGDANWQFTERGTGSQVVTNSGIAASSTDPFYIQIITGIVTQMNLLDYRFIPLATRSVGVLSKPAATTLVSIIVGCETQTGASRAIRWFHINEHSRSS